MELLTYSRTTKDQSRDTGMAMVLILLIAYLYTKNNKILLAAVGLQVVAMAVPAVFRPMAVLWLNFSRLLGEVVSRILLSIVYFAVVTPIGILRRLRGNDSLHLYRFKKSNESVMLERTHKFEGRDLVRPYSEENMEFVNDLWNFLRERKKFWLLPLVLILLMFGALVVLASGSAIAPFIYTLF